MVKEDKFRGVPKKPKKVYKETDENYLGLPYKIAGVYGPKTPDEPSVPCKQLPPFPKAIEFRGVHKAPSLVQKDPPVTTLKLQFTPEATDGAQKLE